MNDIWNYVMLNNTVRDWMICFSIIAVSLLVLKLAKSIVLKRLKVFSQKTTNTIDDFLLAVIESSVMPMLYVLAFYFSLHYINMSATAEKIAHIALMLVIVFFVVKIINSFIKYSFNRVLTKQDGNENRDKQARGILMIVNIAVWAMGVLFMVNNLGYNVTTLIAGLGIGGIAIALAAQTILGDLFSYLVIFFDKPFEIGDFIVIGEEVGTVEYIGIKTTRLKTLSGEQLVCSNTDLTNSRLQNFKKMQERRILFEIGVTYDTAFSKLKNIPAQLKKIVEEYENVRFDRAHFKSFGDFSLNFEIVYFVLSADYSTYMDIQQKINFTIFQLFEKEQIEFAFPTQTLFVNNMHREKQPGKKNGIPSIDEI